MRLGEKNYYYLSRQFLVAAAESNPNIFDGDVLE
jgi:hypothetical protein